MVDDGDKNLGRILDQQAQIKMIIDRDGRIKSLKKSILEDSRMIKLLRNSCAKISLDFMVERQELLEVQAKELERFQMQQLKSIAEDYRRHQEILEQRKKEIAALKKETENEERNREAYLADVEKNLERQLQNRQQMRQDVSQGNLLASGSKRKVGGVGVASDVFDPNAIELETVDEYAPYGTAPNSRNLGRSKRARKT